jgi:hypothetical protein
MNAPARWGDRARCLGVCGTSAGWVSCAHAHLVSSSAGPLYEGIEAVGHLPRILLGAVGIALLAGLRGAAGGRWACLATPAGWLAGSAAGFLVGVAGPWDLRIGAIGLLVLGLTVALDGELPDALTAAVAGVAAAVIGFSETAAEAAHATPRDGWLWTAGAAGGMFFVTTVVAAAVAAATAWSGGRLIARVAGSWIGATALLLLGASWAAGK